MRSVRKVSNEIQVTEKGGLSDSAKDFAIETKLKANLLAAKGVTSINYRWRSVNGIVYFLGLARSHEELAKVLTLARQMDWRAPRRQPCLRQVVIDQRVSLKARHRRAHAACYAMDKGEI